MNEEERIAISVLRRKLARSEEDSRQYRAVIKLLEDGEAKVAVPQLSLDGLRAVVQQEQTLERADFPYEKIKGMSQARATIAIARHFGGVIRTKVLAKILMESGVLKRTKNASSMASRLIVESERFDKISDGLYRLKNYEPTVEDRPTASLARLIQ